MLTLSNFLDLPWIESHVGPNHGGEIRNPKRSQATFGVYSRARVEEASRRNIWGSHIQSQPKVLSKLLRRLLCGGEIGVSIVNDSKRTYAISNTQTLQIKGSQIYKFKIPKTYKVKPRPENTHQDVHQVYHEPGLFVASFLSTGDDAFKIVKSEINSSNCSLLISIPYMYTAWRID